MSNVPPPVPVPVISYATPYSQDSGGLWRDGSLLVMAKGASLPPACIKCNAPADGYLSRRLAWHHPALYLLILCPGLLIYAIVALIVSRRATIGVPLCRGHRSRRRWGIAIGWAIAIVGFGFLAMGIHLLGNRRYGELGSVLLVCGLLVPLLGAVVGLLLAQVATPKRIDERFVWLKGVCADYLASLPALGPRT